MSELIVFFTASLGIGALLATIAIWAPRRPHVRIAALVATMLFIPVVYVQLVELLSRPKPMTFEWFERDVQLAQILGSSLDEGKAIYLWLRLDGEIAPRYYVMPWRQQAAEKLEAAAPKKKKKKAKRKSRTKKKAADLRVKLFWGVFTQSMKRVALYEHNQKKQAKKKADELTAKGKAPHFIMKVKEPVEE